MFCKELLQMNYRSPLLNSSCMHLKMVSCLPTDVMLMSLRHALSTMVNVPPDISDSTQTKQCVKM